MIFKEIGYTIVSNCSGALINGNCKSFYCVFDGAPFGRTTCQWYLCVWTLIALLILEASQSILCDPTRLRLEPRGQLLDLERVELVFRLYHLIQEAD